MSITEKEKIDFISTRKETGEIVLTISDHLDWDDALSHLLLLQEKLNGYLHFIESGQIITEYPQSQGEKIVIEIVSKYPYNSVGLQFIMDAKPVVQSIGADLRYTIIPQ